MANWITEQDAKTGLTIVAIIHINLKYTLIHPESSFLPMFVPVKTYLSYTRSWLLLRYLCH
jgi:hypothetical protein